MQYSGREKETVKEWCEEEMKVYKKKYKGARENESIWLVSIIVTRAVVQN